VVDPGLKLDEIEEVQKEVAELLAAEEAKVRGESPLSQGEEQKAETELGKGEEVESKGVEGTAADDSKGDLDKATEEPVTEGSESPPEEGGDKPAKPEE